MTVTRREPVVDRADENTPVAVGTLPRKVTKRNGLIPDPNDRDRWGGGARRIASRRETAAHGLRAERRSLWTSVVAGRSASRTLVRPSVSDQGSRRERVVHGHDFPSAERGAGRYADKTEAPVTRTLSFSYSYLLFLFIQPRRNSRDTTRWPARRRAPATPSAGNRASSWPSRLPGRAARLPGRGAA